MLDWSIQSRGRVCAVTGEPFADKARCHTFLFEQRGGYERLDLSEAAWSAEGEAMLARPNLISHWRSEFHMPPPNPPEAIGKDDAEGLLRRIIELRDEKYAAAAFVLSAMLERKRLLKVRSQLREGNKRVFVYEHAHTGEVIAISDPDLRLDQLEAVQRQVGELLTHGLPGKPEEPGPATETNSVAASVAEPGAPSGATEGLNPTALPHDSTGPVDLAVARLKAMEAQP